MQKKLIALAIAAAASGAAFAQTNVQIYGVVDVGQAWVKSSGAADKTLDADQRTVGRLDSNSSYIGFRGQEDLGNGLKALFQYETAFRADTSGPLAGGRDTFVGLTGGFGTVVAGTLTHPLRAMGVKVELLPGAAGFGNMASVTGTFGASFETRTGADDRATNAIAYVSPSFSGLTATVAYVNGEERESSSQTGVLSYNRKAYQAALQYENGPLWVAAGYHKAIDPQLPAALNNGEGVDARVWRLAGVVTLPTNTKITALYDNTKLELDNLIGGGTAKRQAWSVGAAQTFGASTIGLEYGQRSKTNLSGVADPKDKAKIWTLSYGYNLSKRTMLHARYSKLTNDKEGMANFYAVNNPVGNPNVGDFGSDYTGYMVGLRHSF